ncbi:MAG: histidinol-phosphate transaminase [Acidobacteriaceae bacterium]|nr:histidinol-phosphate transaminase [Acidobacteriaceae bacterium]
MLSGPTHIHSLRAYEAGLTPEQVKERYGIENAIKLSSNENPLGTSPVAIEYAIRALSDMSRYPDGGVALRRKLADRFGVKVENVIVGAGSEGIIANIVRTFLCDEDEILTTEAAFLGFQVLAKSRGIAYRTVPYRNWTYDLPAIADAVTERTKLIYLANPNNPTGTFFTREEFEAFYARIPDRVLIILDEAYFEFAAAEPDYPDSMHYRFDNVITLRTFSKAYGLAAARVGYGFAHEDLISVLLKVKLPFEPSGPSAAAALGALEDAPFMKMSIERNRAGLEYVRRELTSLGYRLAPSAVNFVMLILQDGGEADSLFELLLREGVIVRPLKATGIPNCLRISVGTERENSILIDAITRVQSQMEIDRYASTR